MHVQVTLWDLPSASSWLLQAGDLSAGCGSCGDFYCQRMGHGRSRRLRGGHPFCGSHPWSGGRRRGGSRLGGSRLGRRRPGGPQRRGCRCGGRLLGGRRRRGGRLGGRWRGGRSRCSRSGHIRGTCYGRCRSSWHRRCRECRLIRCHWRDGNGRRAAGTPAGADIAAEALVGAEGGAAGEAAGAMCAWTEAGGGSFGSTGLGSRPGSLRPRCLLGCKFQIPLVLLCRRHLLSGDGCT